MPDQHWTISTPNPYTLAQRQIADALNADAWFPGHGVSVLIQDQGDIMTAIDTAVAQIGLCCVVAFDSADRTNGSQVLSLSVIATEYPATNRSRADYATALDTVHRARLSLGQDPKRYALGNIDHTITEDGIYQATLRLRMLLLTP